MGYITAGHVLELNTLQVVPDALIWVELRRVSGQSLEMDSFSSTVGQKGFDHLAAMDRGAIPDNEQLAWDMLQQMLQEANDIWPFERAVLHHRVQLALWREGTDRGQVGIGEQVTQDRCLSNGCVGPYDHRQQIEARFVHEHQRVALCYGFFCSSGQRSSCQRRIASSSRCRARRIGF